MFEKTSRERLRNQVSKIEAQDKHRKHVQVRDEARVCVRAPIFLSTRGAACEAEPDEVVWFVSYAYLRDIQRRPTIRSSASTGLRSII